MTFPLNPWRWIKKKGTQSFPHSLWAVTAMCCTHKTRQGLLRNSQLWGSFLPSSKSQRPTGNTVVSTMARLERGKCVSGFTAIYSEPTDRIPSGRVRSTGCKISLHLNKRHVGLDTSPPPPAAFAVKTAQRCLRTKPKKIMFCEDNLSSLVLSWLQKYSIPVFSQGHFNSFPISSYMLLQLLEISGVKCF